MTRIRFDGKGRFDRAHSQPAVPGLPCRRPTLLSRCAPTPRSAGSAGFGGAVSVHRRPPRARRPGRLRRRRAGRRRRHHPASRQGLGRVSRSSDRWRPATSWPRSRCWPTRRAATTRCSRSTTGPTSPGGRRRRAASRPGRPAAGDRPRHRRTAVADRPLHPRPQQVAAALAEPADYFCVGPCWPTPTKPGRPAPGLDLVRTTRRAEPDKPWFAIGGIDEQRLPEVLAAGARRVVVVRAITAADDPQAAARRLKTCSRRPVDQQRIDAATARSFAQLAANPG